MVKRKSDTPRRVPPQTPSKKPKMKPKYATTYFNIGNKVFKLNKSTLQDIRNLQARTCLCIPKLPFSRLIREILMENTSPDMKVQREALTALQEAAEMYVTQMFEDSNRCAGHAKRITVLPRDMQLVLSIRGVTDPGFPSRRR